MDGRNSLFPYSVASGGLAGFLCQDDTTESRLYYRGMSVQTLDSPCSAYFSQSNADQNSAHPINPLNEFRVASLVQAVPDSFGELDLTVIPKSILDEYVPLNSDNEPVDDASLSISSSSLCNRSCFSENEPDIREPSLANLLNLKHHLTDPPFELAYPQDSRPVAVVNLLNLQQATSDNPAKSAKIVADKSSQAERARKRHRELQRERRKNPAFRERENECKRRRRQNPANAERERERQRERYRNDPAFVERLSECRRKRYRNDPAYAERLKARARKRGRGRYRNDPVHAECRRIYHNTYNRMKRKAGKKEASRLASVAREQ